MYAIVRVLSVLHSVGYYIPICRYMYSTEISAHGSHEILIKTTEPFYSTRFGFSCFFFFFFIPIYLLYAPLQFNSTRIKHVARSNFIEIYKHDKGHLCLCVDGSGLF